MATTNEETTAKPYAISENGLADLRQRYGCGPIEFTGSHNALYERHLLFDHVVDLQAARAYDRYDAFARSVRA